jgi:hypothetical protein
MKNKAKYLRRRVKEKANKLEQIQRQKKRDQEWLKIQDESRERQKRLLEFQKEWKKQEQNLVNVLAKRLCDLSPEYRESLRGKEAMKTIRDICNAFGGSSLFGVKTISEEPYWEIGNKEIQ